MCFISSAGLFTVLADDFHFDYFLLYHSLNQAVELSNVSTGYLSLRFGSSFCFCFDLVSRAVRAPVMAFFLEAVASLLCAEAYARKNSASVAYSLPVQGPAFLGVCQCLFTAKNTANKLNEFCNIFISCIFINFLRKIGEYFDKYYLRKREKNDGPVTVKMFLP